MKNLAILFSVIFTLMVAFYFIVLKPEKYTQNDVYDEIVQRGTIRVGINTDSKPFGFVNKDGFIQGYDADLAKYLAQYLLNSQYKVEFIPVTPSNRIMKVSTGEVDMVIATMTVTPSREEIIDFSIPYDTAGQALLVKSTSKITSVADLGGQNVGVVWGTTAEKNMLTLAPTANVIGFKTYNDAYNALKSGYINAITSDDTILSRYALEDKNVKLLPKRYSREPYGIGFKKGKSSAKLREKVNFAIKDMNQKNVIPRLRKKWLS